jgi:hypothetical protein
MLDIYGDEELICTDCAREICERCHRHIGEEMDMEHCTKSAECWVEPVCECDRDILTGDLNVE